MKDHYNRVLAYVWLSNEEDREVQTDMLNGVLLKEGYAINKEYKPNITYSEEFQDLVNQAEKEEAGLWKYEEIKEFW